MFVTGLEAAETGMTAAGGGAGVGVDARDEPPKSEANLPLRLLPAEAFVATVGATGRGGSGGG